MPVAKPLRPKSVSLSSRIRRGAIAAVTALATACAGFAAPTVASAQGGNIVVFGDSYTASPDEQYNFARGTTLSSDNIPADYPRTGRCLQDWHNWPRQMQRRTGITVRDWSCTAETSSSMLARIASARKSGHLNAGTRAVFLAIGGNDIGPYGLARGHNPFDQNSLNRTFSANIARAKAAIQASAPNAQIVVAGLPEVTNGTGICLINVVRGNPVGIPVAGEAIEGSIRSMQRYGAYRNGLKFVDNYALTRGHNTCATNDRARYVNGWLDTTSTRSTMPIHPTYAGHSALAANNARAIGL